MDDDVEEFIKFAIEALPEVLPPTRGEGPPPVRLVNAFVERRPDGRTAIFRLDSDGEILVVVPWDVLSEMVSDRHSWGEQVFGIISRVQEEFLRREPPFELVLD